jgi:hypothetical protein
MNALENDSTQQPHRSTTTFPHICGDEAHKADGFEPWRSLLHDAVPRIILFSFIKMSSFSTEPYAASPPQRWRTGKV